MSGVDWIRVELFVSYPLGYYQRGFLPDGTVEYNCEGEDLPYVYLAEWTPLVGFQACFPEPREDHSCTFVGARNGVIPDGL